MGSLGTRGRLERAVNDPVKVTRIGDGVFRVDQGGRIHVVHVAGTGPDLWMHWNGRVFHRPFERERVARHARASSDPHQSLSAPMPGTVLKVLAVPGSTVHKGDTLIVLEAMKMELPIRASSDGVVSAVHCREGELVQPGAVLLDLE
jgi:3-methylcrotonyl-CoA carboxylase alpha subunit